MHNKGVTKTSELYVTVLTQCQHDNVWVTAGMCQNVRSQHDTVVYPLLMMWMDPLPKARFQDVVECQWLSFDQCHISGGLDWFELFYYVHKLKLC